MTSQTHCSDLTCDVDTCRQTLRSSWISDPATELRENKLDDRNRLHAEGHWPMAARRALCHSKEKNASKNHGIRAMEKSCKSFILQQHMQNQMQYTGLGISQIKSWFNNIAPSRTFTSSIPCNSNYLVPTKLGEYDPMPGCKGKAVVESNTRRPTMPALVPNQHCPFVCKNRYHIWSTPIPKTWITAVKLQYSGKIPLLNYRLGRASDAQHEFAHMDLHSIASTWNKNSIHFYTKTLQDWSHHPPE